MTGRTQMPLTEELGELLYTVMRSMKGHIISEAAAAQLTPQQIFMLHLLMEHPISMSALAEKLHCDASNVTGLADRLESRGLVERGPHPSDRRVKQLTLTTEGSDLIRTLNSRIWRDSPVGTALDEADQLQLRDLLRKALGEHKGDS